MKTKKMKRSSIICTYMLAAVFLLGCENEIPYHPGSHKPLLIMNALLTAGEAENYVYLHLSEGNSIKPVKQATLSLYVNGQLAEEPQPVTPSKNAPMTFCLRTVFRPGDYIRLEATAEGKDYCVESEVTVPQPVKSIQVDTCVTKILQWGGMRDYRRILVSLHDLPGEKNYYRLEVLNNYRIKASHPAPSLNEDGSQVTDESGNPVYHYKDTIFNYTDRELINREDIILTDGHISNSDQDEDNEMFPIINNKYNIFTDSQFANSHATLKVYTALGLDYLNGYQNVYASLQSLSVRVLSLNRDEYLYFKGLNCMDDDYDATLMEPVSLPTNVKGGLGFVGLCAGTQITMDFPK